MRVPGLTCLCALALTGCSDPATFQELDPHITDVSAGGPYLNLRVEFPRSRVPGETVVALDRMLASVSEGLQSGLPGPNAQSRIIRFDVRFVQGDYQDRFGNYSMPIEALRREDLPNHGLVNLIDDFQTGSGDTVTETISWCANASALAVASGSFCDQLASAWALQQAETNERLER